MRKIVENYSDNDYWYRKYDDGLIEQGGKVMQAIGTDGTYIYTFPRAFTSTPIYMNITVIAPRSSDSYGHEFTIKKDYLLSTEVTIFNDCYGTNVQGFYWEAIGY